MEDLRSHFLKCNHCGWFGDEDEIEIVHEPKPDNWPKGKKWDVYHIDACPECEEVDFLINLTK